MNKLTKTQFARPIVRDAMPCRGFADIFPFRRRARRALVCVWRTDPETGRLACSWTEPTDGDQCLARDLGEPPPALLIAA
jgi:hypothetical protein